MSIIDFSAEELTEVASAAFFGMDLDSKQLTFLREQNLSVSQEALERFEKLNRVRFSILVKILQAVCVEQKHKELRELLKQAEELMLVIGGLCK
jgi:hypothetical protein